MKKPPTSVHVVIRIVADVAGSLPSFFIIRGISAPAKAAINKLQIIATANTNPSMGFLFSRIATSATKVPLIAPFITPAAISRPIKTPQLASDTSCITIPRTVTARV